MNMDTFIVSMIGGVNAGKSFITNKILKREHDLSITGQDFGNILYKINEKTLKLQIWDQKWYHFSSESMINRIKCIYYRSHVMIMIFDVNNLESFNVCKTLVNETILKQPVSRIINNTVFLIGNKVSSNRVVSVDEATQFSYLFNIMYTEIDYQPGKQLQSYIDDLLLKIATSITNKNM
ncbi:Rab1a [Hexamita inflata]|uniref:Rab1a n=1 Tax=Hexamita inflata TaxID=28002 RepID=A0AA86UQU4_9EUKA|nr:Rab1a [Hexamita inflata]